MGNTGRGGQTGGFAFKAGVVATLAILIGLMSGCDMTQGGPTQQKLAVAFIVDPTFSAQRGRAERQEEFKRVVTSYLPDDTAVSVIICDHHPTVEDEVNDLAYHRRNILKSVEAAFKPRPCSTSGGKTLYCGTDPVGALRLSMNFLAREEYRDRRKLIIGWTDLIADPCVRYGTKKPITFLDPARYDWEGVRGSDVEVILFGVPELQQSRYRSAWNGRFRKSPRMYGPKHRIDPQVDLGLKREQIF